MYQRQRCTGLYEQYAEERLVLNLKCKPRCRVVLFPVERVLRTRRGPQQDLVAGSPPLCRRHKAIPCSISTSFGLLVFLADIAEYACELSCSFTSGSIELKLRSVKVAKRRGLTSQLFKMGTTRSRKFGHQLKARCELRRKMSPGRNQRVSRLSWDKQCLRCYRRVCKQPENFYLGVRNSHRGIDEFSPLAVTEGTSSHTNPWQRTYCTNENANE